MSCDLSAVSLEVCRFTLNVSHIGRLLYYEHTKFGTGLATIKSALRTAVCIDNLFGLLTNVLSSSLAHFCVSFFTFTICVLILQVLLCRKHWFTVVIINTSLILFML